MWKPRRLVFWPWVGAEPWEADEELSGGFSRW